MNTDLRTRITSAWQGRISGCLLGKPIEVLSMRKGQSAVDTYLARVDALPLRDYIPCDHSEPLVDAMLGCCRGEIDHSEPDDDIHYSVLALMMLEHHGRELTTNDVARSWLRHLPAASTFTAERAAYGLLLEKGDEWFPETGKPGFDLEMCSDNPYNDWIGAQIRADVYGWVTPGNPELAAKLAVQDASLSHRGDGVMGAVFVAVMGALIPVTASLSEALEKTLPYLDLKSGARAAVELGQSLIGNPQGGNIIRDHFDGMSPVHTLNNLALVVWSLLSHEDDFSAAIGEVVAAGLDTDCNGATVGGLWGLMGRPIPQHWVDPWQGRVGLNLAGQQELTLSQLVDRTIAVVEQL